jgi:hypothetical protein
MQVRYETAHSDPQLTWLEMTMDDLLSADSKNKKHGEEGCNLQTFSKSKQASLDEEENDMERNLVKCKAISRVGGILRPLLQP